MPIVLAFLTNPMTWASAFAGAFVGSQLDDKLEPKPHPYDMNANKIDVNKTVLYAAIAVGIYYVAKKVIK